MGQKINSKLLFISSLNIDGFYRLFYISQGNVATQLRFGGIFSNHLLQIFHRICRWKTNWKSINTWRIYGQNLRLTFWPTRYTYQRGYFVTIAWKHPSVIKAIGPRTQVDGNSRVVDQRIEQVW